ncbi:hypothetical protein BDK51DRAFT_32736, partial [Blyttiomyces helicus]
MTTPTTPTTPDQPLPDPQPHPPRFYTLEEYETKIRNSDLPDDVKKRTLERSEYHKSKPRNSAKNPCPTRPFASHGTLASTQSSRWLVAGREITTLKALKVVKAVKPLNPLNSLNPLNPLKALKLEGVNLSELIRLTCGYHVCFGGDVMPFET